MFIFVDDRVKIVCIYIGNLSSNKFVTLTRQEFLPIKFNGFPIKILKNTLEFLNRKIKVELLSVSF